MLPQRIIQKKKKRRKDNIIFYAILDLETKPP
jgi:hypothetical protein